MSITVEKFQEFAELALTAFNSQKATIAQLTEQLGTCPAQLAEALGNDAADKAAIEEARANEAAAKQSLETLSAKNEADSQEFLDKLAKLQTDLGLTLPSLR